MAARGPSEEKTALFDWKAALEEVEQLYQPSIVVSQTEPINIPKNNGHQVSTKPNSLQDKMIFGFLGEESEMLSQEEKFDRMIGSAPGAHDWRRRAMRSSSGFSPLRESKKASYLDHAVSNTIESSDPVISDSENKLKPNL